MYPHFVSARSRQRPALKERVREAVSEAIIDAVEHVASERGLENTSIAAIAERAGVAVGTLYNYFEDRDAILAAWLAHRRAEIVPLVAAAARARAGLAFEPRLRGFLADVLTLFDERRRFLRVLAGIDQARVRGRVRQRGVLDTLVDAFRDIVEEVDPDRAEQHAHMLVGAVRAITQLYHQRDTPMAAEATLIGDVFLGGIRRR